jgi:Bor protein
VSARGAVLALALACLVSGCAETYDATTLGVQATLASPAGSPAAGDHFRVSSRAVFGFWGLATLKQPSLRKALAAQLGGGAGVADVKIKTRSRFTDILFTVLTAGILVPRTVTFEGVVTK